MNTKNFKIKLSNREKDVCTLLINGLYYKEIAKELGISYDTVRTHVQRIKLKTRCCNLAQLSAFIVTQNLLEE